MPASNLRSPIGIITTFFSISFTNLSKLCSFSLPLFYVFHKMWGVVVCIKTLYPILPVMKTVFSKWDAGFWETFFAFFK